MARNGASTAAESRGESGCPPLPQQQSRVFDAETGDVILVLQEQEHSVFKRNEPLLVEAELEITFLGCRKNAGDDITWRNRSVYEARVRPT